MYRSSWNMDLKRLPAFEAVDLGSDLMYPCQTQTQDVEHAKSLIVNVSVDIFLYILLFQML